MKKDDGFKILGRWQERDSLPRANGIDRFWNPMVFPLYSKEGRIVGADTDYFLLIVNRTKKKQP